MAFRIAIGYYAATRPLLLQHLRFPSTFNPTTKNSKLLPISALFSSSSASTPRKVILYSKPGCCLCDGLKEKLDAAFSLSDPNCDVRFEIRDITSNPEWERLYQYEIPVLARVREDGTEETLPRLSPRLGVELVRNKIAAAFNQ
ncbi:hypothetical protein OROGR_026473 [Orobanche gracilis]